MVGVLVGCLPGKLDDVLAPSADLANVAADEVIAEVDAVTIEEVRQIVCGLFSQPDTLAIVGP